MKLAGSAWTLVSFETDTEKIPAVTEAPATLIFSAEDEQTHRLSGSGGCNRYFASYTLAGDRLSIGPLGSTRMMCGSNRMAQEDRFFQALSTAERCEQSNGELLIAFSGGMLRFMPVTKQADGSAPR
ncbi:MAG TPA: META domain-containing protein [Ktedonobacteraceae bacterium]|nr:META domain-containing protein [Ktedonobacteraceae bacterium]